MSIYIKTLFLCLLSFSLWAQERDGIEIRQEDLHVRLRPVDIYNLSSLDQQTIIDLSGDYEAVTSMFGKLPSMIFKVVHFFSPETILETYRQAYIDKKKKMPAEHQIEHHYFIEDLTQNGRFMANLSISTFVDSRPAEYQDKLLIEVGLMVQRDYRRKKITKALAKIVFKALSTVPAYCQGQFCFATDVTNIGIHKIAATVGANLILQTNKEVDFGLFKKNILIDLFVVPTKFES